jgi:DNA-binding CsgD family transcriptional regulator
MSLFTVWVNYILFYWEALILKSKVDREVVKILYIDEGLNAPEIAKKLNLKVDSVKKCIHRNFEKDKLQHKKARFNKKEIEKAINYEATKCMTDVAFIKKNPSIYKVVAAPEETLPWDVPIRLKNEDSEELVEKRLTSKYKDMSNELLN